MDLAFIWAVLIAFAVLAYVLFDGSISASASCFPLSSARTARRDAIRP